MASYELSGPADRDLTDIYTYSFRQFGEPAADAYLLGLLDCFARLAAHADLGRSIESFRAGYFRFEHASHVVFYTRTARGIRVMRILHERMDPGRHI